MKGITHLIIALLCATVAIVGCKRVETVEPDAFGLLPLAVGNRWVYVDSIFAETDLPSRDTLVQQVSYRIESTISVDLKVKTGSGKSRFVRTTGWTLLNDSHNSGREYLLVRGDTLYSTARYLYIHELGQQGSCGSITTNLQQIPSSQPEVQSSFSTFRPLIWDNGPSATPVACYPGFMDLPFGCFGRLDPVEDSRALFRLQFPTMVRGNDPVTITVPAGTFVCEDFGYQKWAEGVGMVSAELIGAGEWMEFGGRSGTGTLRWRRVLSSFSVN